MENKELFEAQAAGLKFLEALEKCGDVISTKFINEATAAAINDARRAVLLIGAAIDGGIKGRPIREN